MFIRYISRLGLYNIHIMYTFMLRIHINFTKDDAGHLSRRRPPSLDKAEFWPDVNKNIRPHFDLARLFPAFFSSSPPPSPANPQIVFSLLQYHSPESFQKVSQNFTFQYTQQPA